MLHLSQELYSFLAHNIPNSILGIIEAHWIKESVQGTNLMHNFDVGLLLCMNILVFF